MDRELSCSCFRCDNDAPSPGPPTLTKVFHNPVGSCCHSCGLGSGFLGLLLGTWAGLFRGGRRVTGSFPKAWRGGGEAAGIEVI